MFNVTRKGAMLKTELFALLADGSLYRVTNLIDSKGQPVVELVAKGMHSRLEICSRLDGGTLVGISGDGIMLIDDTGRIPHSLEFVPENIRGDKTSSLAALFADSEKAIAAWIEGFKLAPEPLDMRWQHETAKALESIKHDKTFLIFGELREMFFEEKSFVLN